MPADPLPPPDPAVLDALERRFTGPVPRPLRDACDRPPEVVSRRRAAARAQALAAMAAAARLDACTLRTGRHLSAALRHRLDGCASRLAWARGRAETWRRRAAPGAP